MRIRKICIYQEFQCTGAECRANCCRGWKVPLDAAICGKYRDEKEKLGPLFRFAVKRGGDVPTLRSVFGRCLFWGKDHLCGIQKKYGTDYMARICIQFPRRLSNLGFLCEETLYLACPEAARLFLERVGQGRGFTFEETEGEAAYLVNTTNDDEDFLAYLLKAREQLTGMLRSGCGFDSMAILQYGQDAREACLKGRSCPCPSAYQDMQDQRPEVDCATLNRLFFSGFYHPCLKLYSPFLHRLCVKYIAELGILCRVNRKAADRKLAALREGLYGKMPEADRFFNGYYEYYLQSEFLDIFEDYSFSKCLLYGMAKAHMLWVLIALYARDRERLTQEEIAEIIAVYERRAPQIKEALAGLQAFRLSGG